MRLVSCDRQKIPDCGRARQQGAALNQQPHTNVSPGRLGSSAVASYYGMTFCVSCRPKWELASGCSFCSGLHFHMLW